MQFNILVGVLFSMISSDIDACDSFKVLFNKST